ncbi:MAG: TM2 domain-containing protein [Muribaculaceae bacterium]|nr:TM2 domain-containing protein [Muribaculaceae bacterium]
MKSKTTAILLCFFLGGFGAHWFYLGKMGFGILYLLTGGLCGIGTLVNFIQFLMMSNEDFDAKYNTPAAPQA